LLSSHTHKTKALIALGWVSLIWGTTWLVSKQAVRTMPALQLTGIRQVIAGVLYIIYFIIKKEAFPKGKQWRAILILSFLNFMLSNALSTWGVKYISSGLGAIIAAIFPLWLAILTMIDGSRIPRQALIGLLLGFGGVCIIFYEHLKDLADPTFRFGIFLSVSATISWAFGTLYIKKQAMHFNPYFSLGFQMLISGIVLLTGTHITGNDISLSSITTYSWWSILYLIVFGSILTFMAYIYSLQHLPTALASVYAYINPIIAVLLGALVVGEKLTVFIAIGGLTTIIGVYLVNNSLKKKTIPEELVT
jgi:drug/metabolite transporter (DMT)-like permease